MLDEYIYLRYIYMRYCGNLYPTLELVRGASCHIMRPVKSLSDHERLHQQCFFCGLIQNLPSIHSENPVPSFPGTLVDELLRKLPQSIGQFFRLASISGVGCLYILDLPFHAALFHKHVLQKRRQGLVLHASYERNFACKIGVRPAHGGCGGVEGAHRGWPEEFGEVVGFTVIKVVEKNISRAFDRALIGGWLNVVSISRCTKSEQQSSYY